MVMAGIGDMLDTGYLLVLTWFRPVGLPFLFNILIIKLKN